MHLRLTLSTFITVICLSNSYAQNGAVYLQHYNQQAAQANIQTNAISQTNQGSILTANSQGASCYNGQQWQSIKTKSTLYALLDDSLVVYTGGRSSFGYLQRQPNGQYKYVDLTHSFKKMPQTVGDFRFVKKTKQHIYFLSEKLLVQVDREERTILNFWQSKAGQAFQALVTVKDLAFVNITGQGLHYLSGKDKKPSLKLANQANLGKSLHITASFASQQVCLFTTQDNKVYLFNGTQWQAVSFEAQKYLTEHTLTQGSMLSNTTIALGTLNGGVVIADISSGKTLYTINHQTGLPDDEVSALASDNNNGLWIAHSRGISRAVFKLPVNNFSYYPGLAGNLTSVVRWKKQLYVATTKGLFQLKKTQSFTDLVNPIRLQQSPTSTLTNSGGTVVGNLINDIFGRKRRRVQVVAPLPRDPRSRTLLQRQLYTLSSFPYFYHKIPNFSAKVNQIFVLPDVLLLGTNQGLYIYKNGIVSVILKGISVNQIITSPNKPGLVFIASNRGIKSIQKKNQSWSVVGAFAPITSPIYSLSFIQGQLWAGSDNQVFKVQANASGTYESHRLYKLPRYYVERIQVANIEQAPVLFLSNSIYRLHPKKQQFYRDSLVKFTRLPYQIIQKQPQKIWTNFQEGWRNLNDSSQVAYLSLFKQVSDIFQDAQQKLWVISDNQLMKVSALKLQDSTQFSVLLNRVYDHKNHDLPLQRIRLYQGAKTYSLHFELGTTQFIDEQATQYQYRIKGLTKDWSRWQKDARINFTFLPSGKHALEIRARNTLGQLSTVKKVSFRVVPPFWKRWWFYFIEIIVLMGLIVTSAVSSRFERFERYSKLLTFVTIITVFEYLILSLEPSVDNISGGVPVFKLFMNILLAISLSPLERIFAGWLSKNKHRFR